MPNDNRRREEFAPLDQRMGAARESRRSMLERLADVRRDEAPAVVVPNIGMTVPNAAEAMRTMTTMMQELREMTTYTTAMTFRIDDDVAERRREEYELQHKMLLEQKQAWARDEQVLREHLSDTQRRWLDDHGCFMVVSSLGRKFTITDRGASGNVILLDSRGQELLLLCAHVRDRISQAGHMLTQKLCLETSEETFTKVANVYRVLDHAEYRAARQRVAEQAPGSSCECGCGSFLGNTTSLINFLVPA